MRLNSIVDGDNLVSIWARYQCHLSGRARHACSPRFQADPRHGSSGDVQLSDCNEMVDRQSNQDSVPSADGQIPSLDCPEI